MNERLARWNELMKRDHAELATWCVFVESQYDASLEKLTQLRAQLAEMTEARDAAVLVAGVYQAQADGATERYEAMLAAHMEQL